MKYKCQTSTKNRHLNINQHKVSHQYRWVMSYVVIATAALLNLMHHVAHILQQNLITAF